MIAKLEINDGGFKKIDPTAHWIFIPGPKYRMRDWIKLFENFDDVGKDRAHALVAKYGGTPQPYSKLPNGAKKSITHYMTVDGEYDEYKTGLLYAYAEIPVEEFMNEYWRNIIEIHDPNMADDYPTSKHMLDDYRAEHPSKAPGFAGYDFSKHNLTEPWAVILGSEFFEDGAHRLGLYVFSGMEKIPAVTAYDPGFMD